MGEPVFTTCTSCQRAHLSENHQNIHACFIASNNTQLCHDTTAGNAACLPEAAVQHRESE